MNKEIANENELELTEIFNFFLKNKILVLSFTIFFSFLSLIYCLSLPNLFKVDSVVMLNTDIFAANPNSPQRSLLSIINSDQSSDRKKTVILEKIIFSKDFFRKLSLKDRFLFLITFNEEKGIDSDLFNIKTNSWKKKPSFESSYKKYVSSLIFDAEEYSLINLSFIHESSTYGIEILNIIFKEINDSLSLRDREKASENIIFLEAAIESTKITDLKVVLADLIKGQYKTKMFSKRPDDYYLRYIESPSKPLNRYSPKRSLIMILTFIGALFFILFFLTIIKYLNLKPSYIRF